DSNVRAAHRESRPGSGLGESETEKQKLPALCLLPLDRAGLIGSSSALTARSLKQHGSVSLNPLLAQCDEGLENILAVHVVKAVVKTFCATAILYRVLKCARWLLCGQTSEPLGDRLKLGAQPV